MLPDVARFASPPDRAHPLGLVCTGYGYQQRKTQPCLRRRLPCFAAVWINQGRGWFESERTAHRMTISAGSLIWLFPGVLHSYAPDVTTWTEQWVMFEGAVAEDDVQRNLLSPLHPIQQGMDEAIVGPLFLQMRTDFLGTSPLGGLLAGTAVQRLILLNGALPSGKERYRGDEMQDACQWLQTHAHDAIDFPALAQRYGMGYSTFRRQFKEWTGLSPKAYVQRVRLQVAKEQLVLTQQSITDIARAVGFADPVQFSHFFRAQEGISPVTFRQQHKGGA